MNDFAYNPSTGWCRSSVEMKIIDLLEPVSLPTNNEDVRMLPVSNLPDRIATAVTDLIETIQNQLSAASGQEVRMTPTCTSAATLMIRQPARWSRLPLSSLRKMIATGLR